MANFFAFYPPAGGGSSGSVSVTQGTVPWIVAGQGTAGTPAAGVVTVQGIGGGTPIPISGTVTASVPQYVYADSVRYDYSGTPVTTGAWVQLIASTAAAFKAITLFDSSGRTLELGTGAPSSETRILIIPPGGIDGQLPLYIPAGTAISVKAISGNATVGELDITGFNA